MSLSDLRHQREVEIEALNFEGVQIIDSLMNHYNKDNTDKILADLKTELDLNLNEAFARYAELVDELASYTETRIADVRSTTNAKYEEARHRHISEIADLRDARLLSIARSQNRCSARHIEQKRIAKCMARVKDVEGAIETRDRADFDYAAELAERKEQIKEKFRRLRSYLTSQQTEELLHLQRSLASQMATAEDFREKKVAAARSNLSAYIGEELRKKIAAGNTRVTNPLRREDVSRELSDFVNEKLAKEKRTFAFEGGIK
jgi:hypothetical protein